MMQREAEEQAAAIRIQYFFMRVQACGVLYKLIQARDLEIEAQKHLAATYMQNQVRGRRDRRITQRLRDIEAERQRLIAEEEERRRKEQEAFEKAVTLLQGRVRMVRDRRRTNVIR